MQRSHRDGHRARRRREDLVPCPHRIHDVAYELRWRSYRYLGRRPRSRRIWRLGERRGCGLVGSQRELKRGDSDTRERTNALSICRRVLPSWTARLAAHSLRRRAIDARRPGVAFGRLSADPRRSQPEACQSASLAATHAVVRCGPPMAQRSPPGRSVVPRTLPPEVGHRTCLAGRYGDVIRCNFRRPLGDS